MTDSDGTNQQNKQKHNQPTKREHKTKKEQRKDPLSMKCPDSADELSALNTEAGASGF